MFSISWLDIMPLCPCESPFSSHLFISTAGYLSTPVTRVHLPTGRQINFWVVYSFRLLRTPLYPGTHVHAFLCTHLGVEWRVVTITGYAKLFSRMVVPTHTPNQESIRVLLLCVVTGICYCWAFNFCCLTSVHLFEVLICIAN